MLGFEINNVTGWIITTEAKPTSRKEAWLTVIATDNGYYPLSSVCSFKVTIKKNTQMFDKMVSSLYSFSFQAHLHL